MRSTPLSLGTGLALAGALALPLGCEQTPPPVAPTAPVASVPIAAPPPVQVELTPVAEPPDIFVVARWKSPGATLASMGACAGVPQAVVDARAHDLLDAAMGAAFRAGVDGKQLAEILAVEAPIDLVVSLDSGRRGQPDALFAFSVGLTSLDRAQHALEAAGPLIELQPGLWRVGPKGSSELACAIGPAAGAAPARLICGTGDKDVSALGPYLARNVAVAPAPAEDLHAEVRLAPVEARFGGQIRQGLSFLPGLARMKAIGEPRFDRALDAAAAAVAGEAGALVTDLDRLTLDLRVDSGSSCLTASSALQLKGKSSWLAAVMGENAAKQGPAPAIFWRAPLDSETASYGPAADGARAAPILHVLRDLLEGGLAKQHVGSDADRKALGGLLTLPVGSNTNVVFASGHGTGKPGAPSGSPTGSLRRQQIADALTEGFMGWFLVGFDEGPAGLSKMLKDLVGVYGRKGLMTPLLGLVNQDAAKLPVLKLVPAPAALGRGALDLEIVLPAARVGIDEDPPSKPDPKKKASGLHVHVLLMGEAKSTWIAVGADRDELVKRLLASKSGAPDAGTLTVRPGLEPLRSGKALSSGFVTVGAITHGLANAMSNPVLPISGTGPAMAIVSALNNLPHKGDTPIFLTSTATPARGEITVNMSRGSFEDVGAILMLLNNLATTAGLLRP
jgi:hypothetical protein